MTENPALGLCLLMLTHSSPTPGLNWVERSSGGWGQRRPTLGGEWRDGTGLRVSLPLERGCRAAGRSPLPSAAPRGDGCRNRSSSVAISPRPPACGVWGGHTARRTEMPGSSPMVAASTPSSASSWWSLSGHVRLPRDISHSPAEGTGGPQRWLGEAGSPRGLCTVAPAPEKTEPTPAEGSQPKGPLSMVSHGVPGSPHTQQVNVGSP